MAGTTLSFQTSARRRCAGVVDSRAAASAACSIRPVKGTASARRRNRSAAEETLTPCSSMNLVWVGTVAQAARRAMAGAAISARTIHMLSTRRGRLHLAVEAPPGRNVGGAHDPCC